MKDVASRLNGRFVYDEVGGQLLLRTTKHGLPTFFWYGVHTHDVHSSSMTILIGDGPARGQVAHQVTVNDMRMKGTPPPPPLCDIQEPVGPTAWSLPSCDSLEAPLAASKRMPPDAYLRAHSAAVGSLSVAGGWHVRTSVIDFSGFAASLSVALSGVYSHQLGGTVNGITYTSQLDQFGHFLVVPASSVLQPFRMSRRSDVRALEEAFANIALGSTPVLRDTTLFRVCDVEQLEAGRTSGGYAEGDNCGGGAVQCENASVTANKVVSWCNQTPRTASEAASSSFSPSSLGGSDPANSYNGPDEDDTFEQPSPDAAAAFSQMFTQNHAEVV